MSDDSKTNRPPQETPPQERRRVATVVHDDRGNGKVEWRAAPADHERPVLEVLGHDGLSLTSEEVSYDPYSKHQRPRRAPGGKRTDLRKLSEWIKQMRELEERKRNGGDTEGE